MDNTINATQSTTPITITNLKKRKFNHNNNNKSNSIQPQKKKRKLNQKTDDINNNKLNTLIQSNKLLKEENNNLKQKEIKLTQQLKYYQNTINNYKIECNKWKSEYNKLYTQINPKTNNKSNNNNTIITVNNNNSNVSTHTNGNNKPKNKIKKKTRKFKLVSRKKKNTAATHTNTNTQNNTKSPLNNNAISTVNDNKTSKNIVSKQSKTNTKSNTQNNNKYSSNNNIISIVNDNKSSHNIVSKQSKTNTKSNSQNNNIISIVNNKSSDKSLDIYSTVRDRLLKMGFDKTEIINRIGLYKNSNQTPEFVFNQLVVTFTINNNTNTKHKKINSIPNVIKPPSISYSYKKKNSFDTKRNNNKKNTKKHKSFDDNYQQRKYEQQCENNNEEIMNTNSSRKKHNICKKNHDSFDRNLSNKKDKKKRKSHNIEFNCNSYLVSVYCHICDKHFNDFDLYKIHLQNHYDLDSDKVWKQCDFFGCKHRPFNGNNDFIAHIATHTNDHPFECNFKINTIKCSHSCNSKGNLKQHWNRHFAIDIIKQEEEILSNDDIEFEGSYYVSVYCHLCNCHLFNDYYEYRDHLKQHYDNNNNNNIQWLICDFDKCNYKAACASKFIGHITEHTKDYPFNCNKCQHATGMRTRIKSHWISKHKKIIYKKERKYIESDSDSVSSSGSSSFSSYSSGNSSHSHRKCQDFNEDAFEESYIVSVNCHVCDEYFDDIIKYREHIRKHYDNNPEKQWTTCDFGCKDAKDSTKPHKVSNFICHIAYHTQDHPFKCNVKAISGDKCPFKAGTKNNLKNHWTRKHSKYLCEYSSDSESDSYYSSDDELDKKIKKKKKKRKKKLKKSKRKSKKKRKKSKKKKRKK